MNKIKTIIIKSLKYSGKTIVKLLLMLPFMLLKIFLIFKKLINNVVFKPFICFMNRFRNKKTILVTGYVHENNLKFLLERVYKIREVYDRSQATYESNDY